jgi:hypothetical protein
MKVAIDIGSGKSCWECDHLIRNLSVPGFQYGIPIMPICIVFRKKIKAGKKNGRAPPRVYGGGIKN